MFIEIRFPQTRYQLKKKLLFSEIKDTQFRESSPLHRKTDAETSRTYNPKDNQRPLQAGVHRLPLEYLANHISHREKGNESCTTTNSHRYRSKQQRHEYHSKHKQYRTANNGEYHQTDFQQPTDYHHQRISQLLQESTGLVRPHIIIHPIGNLLEAIRHRLSDILYRNSLTAHA